LNDTSQPDLLPDDAHAQRAAARFFVRIGQAGRAAEAGQDTETLPLFPLHLILAAEGTLAPGLTL
jgi:hypothetical protein